MTKMKQKITIIGGSGFVGSSLCKILARDKKNFEIIDLKKSIQFPEKTIIADVRDIDSLRAAITGDVVVNLAAVHRDDVSDNNEYTRTNVLGATNVAQVCVEKNISKIVFTSSVAVYGFVDRATGEEGMINPFNEYGRTKFEAEEILRDWHKSSGRSLIIVRPTVIFGEGNRGNVYNLLQQVASGHFLMIGNGENKKSMAYIENVAEFLAATIVSDLKYGIFNYVDDPNISMNELVLLVRSKLANRANVGLRVPYFFGLMLGYGADLLARLINRKLPVSSIRVKKFASSTEFKSAKSELDEFRAPFTLKEGLMRTLDSEFVKPDPNRVIFYSE